MRFRAYCGIQHLPTSTSPPLQDGGTSLEPGLAASSRLPNTGAASSAVTSAQRGYLADGPRAQLPDLQELDFNSSVNDTAADIEML